MKFIIPFLAILSTVATFSSCHNKSSPIGPDTVYQCPMKCEGEKTYAQATRCPVCKMHLKPISADQKIVMDENEISSESIFNLTSEWNTQNNESILLKDLKGEVLVMVMIYTSCKAACPRLVADMRNIHADVNDNSTKYILVSIDPETDTPKRLKEFAIANLMDTDQWVFLQGTVDDVREFSNVLSVKYKKISPLDFSHSNIISVFDEQGVLVHQQEGLGVDNKETVKAIISLSKKIK